MHALSLVVVTLIAAGAPAPPVPLPWETQVDVTAGVQSVPSSADPRRATVDGTLGVRASLRRWWGPLVGGLDVGLRSSLPGTTGAVGLAPLLPAVTAMGNAPHQVQRGSLTGSAGGTLGLGFRRGDWFLAPTLALGVSGGARLLRVKLDAAEGSLRAHPVLGGYASVGVLTGLRPLALRLDWVLGHERGLPPSGVAQSVAILQVAVGLAW